MRCRSTPNRLHTAASSLQHQPVGLPLELDDEDSDGDESDATKEYDDYEGKNGKGMCTEWLEEINSEWSESDISNSYQVSFRDADRTGVDLSAVSHRAH